MDQMGPTKETLSGELLQALIDGNAARLEELLSLHGRHAIAINVVPAAATPHSSGLLLGVAGNGNTALHLVASRGHAELAALICDKAPSLVATRNKSLDTPLHCAARGGHREVAACLLSKMRAASDGGGVDEAAALRATNRVGDTALHEAVRHSRAEVVDLFMAEAPDLASITSSANGVSPLYLAATMVSPRMVRLLLRPSPDGTASPASSAGRNGRTALHAAAAVGNKEMVQDMLAWEPEGPALLTRVDSKGRCPLHFAALFAQLDVVELLLNANSHQARISDISGWYPVHYAATRRTGRMIDELIKKCPECYDLVDDQGRNFFHFAVVLNNDKVVRYICQNERFALLLNTREFQGNTPLHLAAKNGNARIVSILMQSTAVEANISNRDGLTALDLARKVLYPLGRHSHLLDPSIMVCSYLYLAGTKSGLDSMDLPYDNEYAREDSTEKDYTKGTIASALIASVTFAAALTVPGGFIADDHPHPGTAILATRFAFRAFVVSDTLAFLCSILSTGFLIYGGVSEIPRSIRFHYTAAAAYLIPMAAQFMIATFAFCLHLVLGVANRGLIIFVYMVSSASVLFVTADIWIPLHVYGFVKAIWRRQGWKGLLNAHRRPSGPLDLLWSLTHSPLVPFLWGLFPLLICAPFFIAIALEIAFPNY